MEKLHLDLIWRAKVVNMAHMGSNQSEREKDNRGIVFGGSRDSLALKRHQFVHVTSWGIEHADTEFDHEKNHFLMKITRGAWLQA